MDEKTRAKQERISLAAKKRRAKIRELKYNARIAAKERNHDPQRKKQILVEQLVKQWIAVGMTRKTALAKAKKEAAIAIAKSKQDEIARRRQALTNPGLDEISLRPTQGGVTLE